MLYSFSEFRNKIKPPNYLDFIFGLAINQACPSELHNYNLNRQRKWYQKLINTTSVSLGQICWLKGLIKTIGSNRGRILLKLTVCHNKGLQKHQHISKLTLQDWSLPLGEAAW